MSVTSKPDQAQPWGRRWGRTTAELDDELLQRSAKRHGATPIQVCELGQRCHVRGVLQSVTLRPQAGVPAVSAQLYDGTATVTLIWLGRRRIVGIDPGRVLSAHGRVNQQAGELVMFNPEYELAQHLDD